MAKAKFRKRRKGTPRSQLRRGNSSKRKQRETSPTKASRRKPPKGDGNGHPAAPTKMEYSAGPGKGSKPQGARGRPAGVSGTTPANNAVGGKGGQYAGGHNTEPLPSTGSPNAQPSLNPGPATYGGPSSYTASSGSSSSPKYSKREKAYFRARREAKRTKRAISVIQRDLEQASNQREKEALREERQREQERYTKPEKPASLERKQERQDAREFADKVVGKVPHQAKEGAKRIARVQEKRKLIREVKVAAKMGELTSKSVNPPKVPKSYYEKHPLTKKGAIREARPTKPGKVPALRRTARGEVQREAEAKRQRRENDRARAEQRVLTKGLRQGIKGKAAESRRAAKADHAQTIYKIGVDAFKAKYNRKPMKNELKAIARHAAKQTKREARDPSTALGHDIRRQKRQLKVLGTIQEEGKRRFGERLEQLAESDSGASRRQKKMVNHLLYGHAVTDKRGKDKRKGSYEKRHPGGEKGNTWRDEDAFGAELGVIRRSGRQDKPRLITKHELGLRKQSRWVEKAEEAERLANQGALANALDFGDNLMREIGDIPDGLIQQAGTAGLVIKEALIEGAGGSTDDEGMRQVRAMLKGFKKTDPIYGAVEMMLQGHSMGEVIEEFKNRGRASPISLLSDFAVIGAGGLKAASIGKVSATTRMPYKVAASADAEGLGKSGIRGVFEVGRRRKAYVRAQQAQRNVLKKAKKDAKAEAKAKAGPNESKASIKDRERRIYEQRASDLQEAHNEIMFERYGGGELQSYTRFRGGRVAQKARESWQGFRGKDPFVKTGESGAKRLAKRLGFRFKAERTGEMRGAHVQQQLRELSEAGAMSHAMLSADARAIMDDPNAGWGVAYDAYWQRVKAATTGYLKRGVNEIRRNGLTPQERGDIGVAIGSRMGGLVKDGIEASDLDALIKGAKANGNETMAASYQRLYDDLMENGDHALINSKGVRDAAEVERKFNLETEPEGLTREQRYYRTTIQRYAARNEIADIGVGERAIYDPETRNLIGIERADGSIRAAYAKQTAAYEQRQLEVGEQKAPDVFEAAPGETAVPGGEFADSETIISAEDVGALSHEEIVATLRAAKYRRDLHGTHNPKPTEKGQLATPQADSPYVSLEDDRLTPTEEIGGRRGSYPERESRDPAYARANYDVVDSGAPEDVSEAAARMYKETIEWVSDKSGFRDRSQPTGLRARPMSDVSEIRGSTLEEELSFYSEMYARAAQANGGAKAMWEQVNWLEANRDQVAASMASALYTRLAQSLERNVSDIGPFGVELESLSPGIGAPTRLTGNNVTGPPLEVVLKRADELIEQEQMRLVEAISNSPDVSKLQNRARHQALEGMRDAWMRELVRRNGNRPLPPQAWQPGGVAWRTTVRYELERLRADAIHGDTGAKLEGMKLAEELDLVENWPKHWKSMRQAAIDHGIELDSRAADAGRQLAKALENAPESGGLPYLQETAEFYALSLERLREAIMAGDAGKAPPSIAAKLPLSSRLIEKHRPKPEERVSRRADDGVEPEQVRLDREAKLAEELRRKANTPLTKRERKAYQKRERIRAEVRRFEKRDKRRPSGLPRQKTGYARLAEVEQQVKARPTPEAKTAHYVAKAREERVGKPAPEPSQPPKRSEAAAETDRGVEGAENGYEGPVTPGSELRLRRIYGPRMTVPGAVFRTLRTDDDGKLRIIVTGEPNRYGAIMDPLEGLGDEMGLRDQKVSQMTGTTRVRELDLTDPENDVGAVNRRRHLFNSWQELVDIIKQSSYKGGTPFDDWEAELARLHAPGKERYVAIAADQRSLPKIDGKVDSARVFKGTNIVKAKPGEPAFLMPERMMKVAQSHMRKQGSLEAALHVPARLFVAAVLPFSVGWHVGNMMDLLTRVGVAGAWVDDAKLARRFYEEYSKLVGKDRADAFFVNIAGHYGSQKSVLEAERAALSKSPAGQKVTQGANQLLDKMDEAYPGWGASVRDLGSAATAPARGLRWASQKGFNMASKFEEPYVNMAGGHALRLLARELGLDIGDHVAMAKALARQAQWDKTLMDEFARKAVEIVGDYSMSPWARRWIAPIDPFFRWVVEANKFIFYHFPAKHPVKFLLSAYAAQMGREMAEKLGIDDYLEGNGLFDIALGGTGYLAGAIPIGEGWFRPTSALTSWGETSKMIEDPIEYISGKVFPYFQTLSAAAAGFDPHQKGGILATRAIQQKLGEWFPRNTEWLKENIYPSFSTEGNEWAMKNARAEGSGLLNVLDAGANAFVPGYSVAAQLGREGGVPDNNSWQSTPGTRVSLLENRALNPMAKARPMFGDHEGNEKDYYPDKKIASLAARMKDHLPPTNVNMVIYKPNGNIIQNQGDRFHNEWVEITPEEAKAWEKEHRSSKGSIPLSQRQGGTKTPGGVPVESRPGGANGPGGVPLVTQRGGRETLGKIPLDQMSSKGAAARGLSIVEGIIDTVNDPSTKQAIDVGRRYAEAFEKQQSSGGFRVDGDFSDNQKRYIETLAKETDLDPQAVGAWVIAESGGASTGLPDWDGGEHFGREYFNYLNIGPWMEDEQLFESPEAAAHGTAEFLKGNQWGPGANIPDILPLAAGKGPEAAIAAIERAGWDVANYSGQSGISDLLSQVKVTRTPESKGYRVPRQLRMEAAAIYGQKGLRLLEKGGKIIRAPKESQKHKLIVEQMFFDNGTSISTPNSSPDGVATSEGLTEIAAIGNHGGHVHVSTEDPRSLLLIAQKAKELGMLPTGNEGENPAFDTIDADHASTGYHYGEVPMVKGMRQVKKEVGASGPVMGTALDIAGTQEQMTALNQWVLENAGKDVDAAPTGVKIKGTNLMITEPAPAAAAAVTPSGAPAAAISTGGSAPPTSGGVGSVSRETQGRKGMNPFKGMDNRGDALELALQLLRGEISVLEYVQARNAL